MCATAASGPFENGLDAYNTGDYATALRLWRPLAEQGHADAQYNLGVMYDQGQGVPQDYVQALKWFQLVAGQGHATGQHNLGVMYRDGQGVSQDHVEALKWFQLAAGQGHATGQFNLGVMYANKAFGWVARLRAILGLGVSQDGVQAYKWFDLATSRFPPGEDHDRAVESRDWVAALMTPDQIAEAGKLAREWKPVGERAD